MKGKVAAKADVNMVQGLQTRETPFDGHYTFSILSSMEKTAWVIDSGACSIHICSTPELFSSTYMLSKPVEVHLPGGSSKRVTSDGKVKLNKYVLLVDVLHILGFTHNLLSVAQLIHDFGIKCIFYKDHCVFQKDHSDHLLGVGRMVGNLYVIHSTIENYYVNFFNPKKMTIGVTHILGTSICNHYATYEYLG